ncbi:hypothetical protein ACU8NH_00965 [Rhizobium leguminosarum]
MTEVFGPPRLNRKSAAETHKNDRPTAKDLIFNGNYVRLREENNQG